MKTIWKNLLQSLGVISYFIILDFAYTRMNLERLINDIQVFSGIFLILGIIVLEKAYKKDSGKIAVIAVELLCLSLHSLSIMHVVNMFKYDFRAYMIASAFVVLIYFILKTIVIYTKNKREYLKELSDISEIVKDDEPVKKEATKKKTGKTVTKKAKPKNVKETNEKQVNENKSATKKNNTEKSIKTNSKVEESKTAKSTKTHKKIESSKTTQENKTVKTRKKKESVKTEEKIKTVVENKKKKSKKEEKEND